MSPRLKVSHFLSKYDQRFARECHNLFIFHCLLLLIVQLLCVTSTITDSNMTAHLARLAEARDARQELQVAVARRVRDAVRHVSGSLESRQTHENNKTQQNKSGKMTGDRTRNGLPDFCLSSTFLSTVIECSYHPLCLALCSASGGLTSKPSPLPSVGSEFKS